MCLSHSQEPNKLVFNLWQHLEPANVCQLWILSNPGRGFLTAFHRSAQFAALDDRNWALMAPSCSLESRGAAKTLTKMLFRGSSNVLSPGKAISPSVKTIITAVFILFLFVLVGFGTLYLSLCCTKASGRCKTSPHTHNAVWKLPFYFLKKLKKPSKECVNVRRIAVCSDTDAFFPPRIQI